MGPGMSWLALCDSLSWQLEYGCALWVPLCDHGCSVGVGPCAWKASSYKRFETFTCSLRWRTAQQLELQDRKGGMKEKAAPGMANCPSSAEKETCGESSGLCLPSYVSQDAPCPSTASLLPFSHSTAIFLILAPLYPFLHLALSDPFFCICPIIPGFFFLCCLSVSGSQAVFWSSSLSVLELVGVSPISVSLCSGLSLFKIFLLGSVAWSESISFSVSLCPVPCPSF